MKDTYDSECVIEKDLFCSKKMEDKNGNVNKDLDLSNLEIVDYTRDVPYFVRI